MTIWLDGSISHLSLLRSAFYLTISTSALIWTPTSLLKPMKYCSVRPFCIVVLRPFGLLFVRYSSLYLSFDISFELPLLHYLVKYYFLGAFLIWFFGWLPLVDLILCFCSNLPSYFCSLIVFALDGNFGTKVLFSVYFLTIPGTSVLSSTFDKVFRNLLMRNWYSSNNELNMLNWTRSSVC